MFDIVFEAHGLGFDVSSKKTAFNLNDHLQLSSKRDRFC